MTRWTIDEALKWATLYSPRDGETPSGDAMAMDALAREVRILTAELEKANSVRVTWTTKHQPEETK